MSTSTIKASRQIAAASNASLLPLVGRIGLAGIFLLSGVSKALDPVGSMAYIASVGLPFPSLALAGAILVEILGGVLLVLGYRTRLVAGALALFSLATALFFHSNLGDANQFIHFFKNIAMAGGLAQVVAFGAGTLSLDARR